MRHCSVFHDTDLTDFNTFQQSNSNFLISVFQVQVCALSPVPRHPVVSPSGCLLGRPLLSHPRPRRASVSERLVGTSVLVLDRTAAVLLLQLCAVFNSFTGLLCGPPRDYSFLSAARTSPHNVLVEDPSSRQEAAFSVKLLQAIS